MYNKTLLLTLIALLTAALSCKKSTFVEDSVSIPTTVYVSGYSDAAGLLGNGAYWTDGTASILPHSGAIDAVTVSGKDVYLLGDSVYWKNGVALRVSGAVGLSSIFVSGSDVYLTGFTASSVSSATAAAVYWKNGVMTNLTQTLSNVTAASANSIYVLNSDVYVAGSLAVNHQPAAGVYWKNGVVNPITGAANLTAIVASSAHVIVAGETDTVGEAFWVDNVADGWFGASYFTSLYLSPQSDLYITGFAPNQNSSVAVYWSNAGLANWLDMNITYVPGGTLATGIAVSGSDVYVSGNNLSGQAAYWKNGVINTLGSGVATGIAVTQ